MTDSVKWVTPEPSDALAVPVDTLPDCDWGFSLGGDFGAALARNLAVILDDSGARMEIDLESTAISTGERILRDRPEPQCFDRDDRIFVFPNRLEIRGRAEDAAPTIGPVRGGAAIKSLDHCRNEEVLTAVIFREGHIESWFSAPAEIEDWDRRRHVGMTIKVYQPGHMDMKQLLLDRGNELPSGD